MSNVRDFYILNGELIRYKGSGGNVIIPDSVTKIGSVAFFGCSSLTSVTIPDSVTKIGESAFEYCSSLTTVTIPDSVTAIGENAFWGCSSLTTVTIPDSVTKIGESAFRNCSSLTSVTIPNSVTAIGEWAFSGCSSLTTVTIPNSVTVIGKSAFECCRSLTSVTIPEGVTSIRSYAFYGCESLSAVTISGNVTSIGDDVFDGCGKLTDVTFSRIELVYGNLTDGKLKQYVLEERTWKNVDPSIRTEIFMARQGKTLEAAYKKCIATEDLETLGDAILKRLDSAKTSAKDCNVAAAYMTMFCENVSVATLKALYEKLKQNKKGTKAVNTVESHVSLMEKMGATFTVDSTLSPVGQKIGELLIAEKRSLVDLEKTLKDFYGIVYKDLPTVKMVDGSAAEPQVFAWLLTAHEELVSNRWGPADVCARYAGAELRREAEEVVAMLDSTGLQDALLKLSDENLGITGRSKRMFLAYPICRYADEALMAELCTRAPKWSSSVSGNDAPTLRTFRRAVRYSNTRAAMLLAERYHELDAYAAVHGTTVDVLRDQHLSNVGLDEKGGKAYDLGNQTVIARLQQDLCFHIELSNGKVAKSLPKKNADPPKYEAANKDFSELKKAVRKIVKNRADVLFSDFLSGRERPAEDWKTSYLTNPLLQRVAKLVVWAQGNRTFILTDAEAIDSSEQTYTINSMPIKVAHPVEMKAADVAAWQKYFVTQGLKQPFLQIWEPVHFAEKIKKDRYAGCVVEIYQMSGKDKHGIHSYGLSAYSEDFGFTLDDCTLEFEPSIWRLNWNGAAGETYTLGKFTFGRFNRKVNHIVSVLDGMTVLGRIEKDDVSVVELLEGFTLAQIMEFIAVAQTSNAMNVLAALLEYKNAAFPEFDPMDEFTLEC